jgi:hypothetical protein
MENNAVAVRTRSGEDLGSMPVKDFIVRLQDESGSHGVNVSEG